MPRMLRPSLLRLLALSPLAAGPIAAQQQEGDAAWRAGRFEEARAAYQQVLATDPAAGRANLRMGVMLSWEGKLDSALVHLGRARAADPADVEAQLIQARVLSWNRRFHDAVVRYDSVLAAEPGRREAALERARTLAWAGRYAEAAAGYDSLLAHDRGDPDALAGRGQVSLWAGDLDAAEDAYRAALVYDPRHLDALVGLGYVRHWRGDEDGAERQVRAALAVDSTSATARELGRAVRAAGRGSVETAAHWSNDSDRNTAFWQSLTATTRARRGLRAFGAVSALEASDPVRDASRVGGEAGVSYAIGRVHLTGAAGARRLDAGGTDPRTSATWRARVSWRPTASVGLGVGYARYPFDETALLIARELDLDAVEAGFDATPRRGLSVYGGGGGLWLSDGNRRGSLAGGVTQTIWRRFFIGANGRILGYDRTVAGYFSPDRFGVLEGIAGYNLASGKWDGRFSGGLGGQQVGSDGDPQTEWHLEGRLGRRWGSANRVELFALVTNSAVSSTTGAFRYRTAGVTLRMGI